ncbi:MAG: peptidylprolyl isomerase [Chloroflexia bacterium]
MPKKALSIMVLVLLSVVSVACGGGGSDSNDHITVQHILLSVAGSGETTPFVVKKRANRTPEAAKVLAGDMQRRATSGEDFDKLASQNSDDAPPGIYAMSNFGVPADPGEYPRSNVPQPFGNVSFSLKVGEVGVAPYDPANNPAGYEIIKRIK